MPRVRYGPDITDDAHSILIDQDRIAKQLKRTKSEPARAKLIAQRDLLNKAIKDVFGSRANARKLAAESQARQGYLSPADIRALGVKKYKPVKGKGPLGLPKTPGRGTEKIGYKKGFKPRANTKNPELYKSATQKGKASDILRQVRSQKTAAEAAAKGSRKKAATKATAVKKAATKKKPAKKAAPKKKR